MESLGFCFGLLGVARGEPSKFAYVSSIDVDLIYLPQYSVSQAKKVTMEWLQIQKSMILLPILSMK